MPAAIIETCTLWEEKMDTCIIFTKPAGIVAIGVLLASCAGSLPTESVTSLNLSGKDFYRFKDPSERLNRQTEKFGHEYIQIARRRSSSMPVSAATPTLRPENIIGLGLSGGGIRSASFQLGLLSGLHGQKQKEGNKSLLESIDYISSVSGGSWANGAYWIWQRSDQELFDCLDKTAKNGKDAVASDEACKNTANMLRTEQKVHPLNDTKEKWHEDVQETYFAENCKEMNFGDKSHSCWPATERKPYPIIMATHSGIVADPGDKRNLPFEYTPDYLGTIADCDSERIDCESDKNSSTGQSRIGFFVNQNAKGFEWRRRQMFGKHSPGTKLSIAMAQSSGVLTTPKGLSWSMELVHGQEALSELRDNYWLLDGGYTDNLGLIPLIERGADLIILSDIGYSADKDQPGNLQKYFGLSQEQVKKLFGCTFDKKQSEKSDMFQTWSYECPNAEDTSGNHGRGTIIYVKPFFDIVEEFTEYLKGQKTGELAECILKTDKSCYGSNVGTNLNTNEKLEKKYRFPQTDTLLEKYDQRLIRAYYMLGKYISETYISRELRNYKPE